MSSRWQANKIGLINFWYYDEQEFPFVKGRMLLRGANGSGKSVTMQSVVPLLLDGNMSPERLDPFGSRDRKMSSYLLEEDDGREERTGYLYLEFKREESETYLTIGMGIRARKGKPLDKWYFGLTDGRRIGKDFFLYRETDEKVTLSRKELENRIQGGGQVFDRQADYMEFVNRQIFGFETVDEYKEMIDLLIQLRTPKLSKDFKPSVINDILSDSLQPLSDEDLRPMSEAIENMDTMSLNLKARQEAKQAAEKVNHVLNQYNRLILFEKAGRLEENQNRLSIMEKAQQDRHRAIAECEKRVQELENIQLELDAQKDAMEKERESLNKSDAVALKSRELELSDRIKDQEESLRAKEKQLEAKKDLQKEVETKQKEDQDRQYQKKKELQSLLEEMQENAEDMAFQEQTFLSAELQEHFDETFVFASYEEQFQKTQKGIEEGVTLLRQVQDQLKQVEDQRQKRDKNQRETDAAQHKVNNLADVFVQMQNEWKEKLYSWNGRNEELVLDKEQLKSLAQFADDYDENSDYGVVRQTVTDELLKKKGSLSALLQTEQRKLAEIREEYETQEKQLKEWENNREPQPERSEAVLKNRERLRRMNIPYQEFYKVIEFGQHLSKTACDRLEEALSYMGILDAIVVEEQYREQVLAMEAGCHDQYLFIQKQRVKNSILDVLELNDATNDIFFNQRIVNILDSIAYNGEGSVSISDKGTYTMGVLTGTLTGEYEAGFLGSRAREQNRQAKMAACKARMEVLEKEEHILEKAIEELETRMANLQKEYSAFPADTAMRTACRELEGAMRIADSLREEGRRIEEQIREMNEILKELRKEALQIAQKLYLPCNYEAFIKAERASRSYEQQFLRLKTGHEVYLQIEFHLRELDLQWENLEADLEQIRYETGKTEKAYKKAQAEHASIEEQLKLTDYEEIKERLNACTGWLQEYPGRLQKCIEEKTKKSDRMQELEKECGKCTEEIANYKKQGEVLNRSYEAELGLSYVELPEEVIYDVKKVAAFLAVDCQNLQKDAVNQKLNQVYFENRGFLTDYQPMQTQVFAELDATAIRQDIQARYQGVKIPFFKLLEHLEEEIADLQELIKAGDRELFEDILANTVSRKIRGKINSSNAWVDKMNALMGSMNTSSGLKLSLRWRSRTAESEEQLDTKELVELLKKDYRLMREDEADRLSRHFRSKVEEARRHAKDSGGMVSFYQVMKDTLDYRKWFEFQLFSQKSGERQKELTNSVFGTFSGGEKAMSMYVPLFSAVVAKYQGGRPDAPRLISLDEAFAGVDNRNIRDMFRLMTEFRFDFIINSQVLWGDCDTLDALAIYQLLRPENAKFVTVMPYLWNGNAREMMDNEEQLEQRAAQFAE